MNGSAVAKNSATRGGVGRWFRRGPWETVAMTLIGGGIVMLVQPWSIDLYSYSFVTILAGTVGFVIVSHFPE
ncbi:MULTISPECIES: hypothetical protein [unclassified Bradyrhizobium]|uniref:hypothetical protein n=1 Tax=unclassified Bradyrhizobium TaxID=2631580 RepID=UPI001BA85008|nr:MULTISPECIES: hypothetical protein [unclassified Bradyrhizobium]MBR1203517.1 hypothetical protein [Bradyrhizobium sp. AUGA SZCCT0124]MBR1313180.1 hypothetical protein [Bradyrhizobium sp. AUGA SZCCT0051]MBR1341538.1 hypothetical protein [Bradyrhizobium sp. AUGA SZCCT0105]MBR1356524.1 hypothetical protein [Bradyrhizobium sp. AUGA SZCCT0045]